MRCKICNNADNNQTYQIKEMMFGLKEKFTYFQCSTCECLQIEQIPSNISKYYPPNYYSFTSSSPDKYKNFAKRVIKNLRAKYIIFNKGILGKLINHMYPNDDLNILSIIKPTKEKYILDVGCGSGSLLYNLKDIGFKNVIGIDPYIKQDIKYNNGLKIEKKSIDEVTDKWDIIMFHHSFEHMQKPLETLLSVYKLLNQNGICIIRIPTASSYAWKHYKENWIQIDAPRHYFIHSIKSMMILVEKSKLTLEKIIYDSNDFQFWGSEQYIKNIPLMDYRSYSVNKSNLIFSKKEMYMFKQKSKELNKKNQGDTCAFILKKNTNNKTTL